ncbi:MAG TPA: DUF72 domain-containing protein [Flavisolibacter sp.]|nr:DUF72 domain-containing protein [Flavisolibacter sp.]
MSCSIHIGTSGWSYKHWKLLYYPAKLKSTDWLSYYAQTFKATEINGSFYRLPTQETVINWMNKVPKGFIFCPKMSRYLTHMKKLHDPEESVERFFSIFEPMKNMMGPVLLQLPPFLKFNYDIAERLYSILQKQYSAYEFVMEVRHDTWLHNDSLTLMTKYNIGFVISHSNNEFPYSEMVTAKNIYVRFHGPVELYASSYSNDLLKSYVKKFKAWIKEGHVLWVFFNNDIHGYAIENAKTLMKMIT